jgi:hypothetical protein
MASSIISATPWWPTTLAHFAIDIFFFTKSPFAKDQLCSFRHLVLHEARAVAIPTPQLASARPAEHCKHAGTAVPRGDGASSPSQTIHHHSASPRVLLGDTVAPLVAHHACRTRPLRDNCRADRQPRAPESRQLPPRFGTACDQIRRFRTQCA